MGNLYSKFGKNRSTNYVTLLSTVAGRTDGRTDGRMDGRMDGRLRDFIVCPMHMHMHWTDNNVTKADGYGRNIQQNQYNTDNPHTGCNPYI